MFDNLTAKLEGAFKRLSGQGRINEVNIAQTMGEVRRALLEADVNYQVARSFTNRIKDKALGTEVLRSVVPGQMLVKIVYDELVMLLGGASKGIKHSTRPPTVILVAGLQGSGKTTFCGKLALHLKQEGRAPLLAAADVYRPAAVDQLRTLAAEVDVPVYALADDTGAVIQDAPRVATEAVAAARKNARDVVIIDTAGRLHVDATMMAEVADIKQRAKPSEILFVVDSMTGQDAVNTAREFNNKLNFDGVVLTKLDGDARGGAALSIRSVVKKPIKFASTGEKLSQLMPFHPDRMARRILGMGDVVSLVEKAQQQVGKDQAAALRKKIRKEQFNLQDMLDQLRQVERMGGVAEMAKMLPQAGHLLGDAVQGEKEKGFGHTEAIILSMTHEERARPQIINGSRRRRIARGAGLQVRDVNEVLRSFRSIRLVMKRAMKMKGRGRQMGMAQMMQLMQRQH